jgi:hypothetical protein
MPLDRSYVGKSLSYISARNRRNREPLTGVLVYRVTARLFAKRNDYGINSYEDIVEELAKFGILNRGKFSKLMKRHRRELLRIDRERLAPWEIKYFSEWFGEASVKDGLRRQYWFALPAMIRIAMELQFGEDAAVYGDDA